MEGPMMGGYLSVPSQKALKKTWSKRYFLLYPTSGSGVVRLLQFESMDQAKKGQKGAKIIPLKDCVAITPSTEHKSQPNVIDIVFPDKTLSFAAEKEKELNNWYLKLCKAVFGGNSPNVLDSSAAAPPPYSPPQMPQPPPYRATEPPEGATAPEYSGMADNVIYDTQQCLSYQVIVRLTEAAQHCGLDGPYLLQVNPTCLTLQDRRTNQDLYSWPYKYLRRYGRDKTQFSLEAGRKCASGEGKFEFATSEGNSIFSNVDAFVKGRASITMDISQAPSQRKESGENLKRDPTLPPRNYSRPQSTGLQEMSKRPPQALPPRPISDGGESFKGYQQVNKPEVKPRLSQKAEVPESDLYEPLGDYYAELDDVKAAVGREEPEYSEAEMRMQAWKQQGRSVKESELASATFDPKTEDYHVPVVPKKSKPPPVAPRAKKKVDHIYDEPPTVGEDSEDYNEPTEVHSHRPPGFEDDDGVYEDTAMITKPAKKPPAPPPPVPRHAPKARKPAAVSPYEEPPKEISGLISRFNKMQSEDDGSYDSLDFGPEGKKNQPVVAGDGEYGALYSTVPSYQEEPEETYDRLENAISGPSFKDSEGPVYHVLEGPYSPGLTTERHIYDEVPTEQFAPK
ncbi:docking protein 2-like isoform X2 [Branchiostoma lanceolatum]|uniref:docking protein 2-like isoform X2 n=1 Tax=Branchiostoma lanceolatum TaxID=7740 RepID=UPI003455587A